MKQQTGSKLEREYIKTRYCHPVYLMHMQSTSCEMPGLDPFQGPKLGSCLTLGNELFEETHLLTKQEILLGQAVN